MKIVLLSAFACDPFKGSEPGYGWNWSVGLVREGYEVHCLTRLVHKESIEHHAKVKGLNFHYISLPFGLEHLYSISQATMYIYYMLWQWKAYIIAKKLHKLYGFELAHHVTWGSIQQGSFLYKLKIPFIFGPAGGGQKAPVAFKEYFLHHWSSEVKREMVSNLLVKFNPACKNMLRNVNTVLVSNNDTYILAQKAGAKNVILTLDVALPKSFFPAGFIARQLKNGNLKMLWVGRFLPRKGLLLVLEVMKLLKAYPGITLTIVGDGEMRGAAEEKWQKYGLENSVTFTGAVSYQKVREYYESHEVFFFTSLRESGGVQLVEAMAFSLPVITIDLHGQGEIVSEKTGIKVTIEEPGDVINSLAKSIVDLSNDPMHYNLMSEAAYSFALNQVWEKKIKEIVERFY